MKLIFNKILILLLLLFLVKSYQAQNKTDVRLASEYYSNKAYDKAVIYYQNIYSKSATSEYYSKLMNCYIELKEFKNGEKLIKRRIKRYSYQLNLMVDLGNIYLINDNDSKAKQSFESAITSEV